MIPRITLSSQPLNTSLLGYGTSRLHHVTHRERMNLIATALEYGIIHFDTAPLYGDGLAERSLGAALKGRRGNAVIATKAGLAPNWVADEFPVSAPVVHAIKALGRVTRKAVPKRPPITASAVRTSVERSLRRLQTDWIDLLLLHEPTLAVLPQSDAVMRGLEDLRREGKVRYTGLAGSADNIASLEPSFRDYGLILQTQVNALSGWGARADIVFGALSSGPQAFGVNARLTPADVGVRLKGALHGPNARCVVVSSKSAERLRQLAALALSETRA